MKRMLVTGSGGVSGVNFVRALRVSPEKIYIAGTDYNRFHIQFPDLDKQYATPRHDDPSFIPRINQIIMNEKIEFVHPNPEVEALIVSKNRDKVEARTFLPNPQVMEYCRDKYLTAEKLEKKDLVPKTILIKSMDDIHATFEELEPPLWLRARKGAGGLASLKCENPEEARLWIEVWIRKKGLKIDDFILQEYLPGRDVAWDSLWANGELITSYARERLEYAFKHLTLTGIAGTPSVSKTIHYEEVNRIGYDAVKEVDPRPHGIYCLDMREDSEGKVKITEVGTKVHTTVGLWAYIATKVWELPWYTNIPYLYTHIACSGEVPPEVPKFDIYPEGYHVVRHIDCGVVILSEGGEKWHVL